MTRARRVAGRRCRRHRVVRQRECFHGQVLYCLWANVIVEGSGPAICWSLTTSVVVLEPNFHLPQLTRPVWNLRIDMLIVIGKKNIAIWQSLLAMR